MWVILENLVSKRDLTIAGSFLAAWITKLHDNFFTKDSLCSSNREPAHLTETEILAHQLAH